MVLFFSEDHYVVRDCASETPAPRLCFGPSKDTEMCISTCSVDGCNGNMVGYEAHIENMVLK